MFGVKVPVPPLQIPDVVGPDITPAKTVEALFLHVAILVPAFTEGGFVKNTVRLSFAGRQLPLFVELKYNFTCPADISAALGK